MCRYDIDHSQVAIPLHDGESDQAVVKLGHEGLAVGAPRRPRTAIDLIGGPRSDLIWGVITPSIEPDRNAEEIDQRVDVARSVVTNLQWRDGGHVLHVYGSQILAVRSTAETDSR